MNFYFSSLISAFSLVSDLDNDSTNSINFKETIRNKSNGHDNIKLILIPNDNQTLSQ